MQAIGEDPDLCLQLVVTGSHLSDEYGLTYTEIEKDGFPINEKIAILSDTDDSQGISKAIGMGVIRLSEAFARLAPDLLLVLGDRFEILSAGVAATALHIPIAHCHGGELTEGALDDVFRHSLTKMAHLHFTSTEQYRNRVIQLGEQPNRVFNVGAFGLEGVQRLDRLSKEQTEQAVGKALDGKNLLVTFHPETQTPNSSEEQVSQLLASLSDFPSLGLIFSLSNADEKGRLINEMIKKYVAENRHRCVVNANLGQTVLFSLLRYIDGVVGNSSSGIIEVPSFGIGTVNIGGRQKGRIRGASVIDCSSDSADIVRAIRLLLSREFADKARIADNLYGGNDVSGQVVQLLKTYPLQGVVRKSFHDLPGSVKE
jgi:GDP/UDP-N,N'-diacetylbacillosamine 2-epimerase (hydrolysing)